MEVKEKATSNLPPMGEALSKEGLDYLYENVFSVERFVEVDPCGIVYELRKHTEKQLDIELGGLFVSMITWGNRKAIRKAALHMLEVEMEWNPSRFVREGLYEQSYLNAKNGCVYRTLNAETFKIVCRNLHAALEGYETMEEALSGLSIEESIERIASWLAPARLGKAGHSACKRICMFLRWMVRKETPDFGLWNTKSQKDLYAVMDVHVCQLTAPILTRRQADWKSCSELTGIFRRWNPEDPLRYDIALMTMADNTQE